MNVNLQQLGAGLVFLAIAFFWTWVAKKVFDLGHPSCDREIAENSNLAVALHRGGLYLAVPLAMTGVLSGPSRAFWQDVQSLMIEGILVVGLLFIASKVSDIVLVPKIDNAKAISEGNVAVALVDMGAFIATGLIARGAFVGEGGGVVAAIVFFLLGQLALVALAGIYFKFARYSPLTVIREGNVAAGLMVASLLISLGIILSSSVAGDFVSWSTDVVGFLVATLEGIIVLLLVLVPIDKVFMVGTSLRKEIAEDRNVAAVVLVAAVQISLAFVITTLFV